MYILKNKKDNIKKVICSASNSFILSNDKIYWNDTLLFEGKEDTDIRICINNFFSFGDSENGYLGDFNSNEIKEFNFIFSANSIYKEGVIIIKNYRYDSADKKVKGDYCLLDFTNNSEILLLKDVEGGIILIFNNNEKGIYRHKSILRSLSLLTGEYEWELDLGGRLYNLHGEEKEAHIQQIIGIWEGVLLVSLSNSNIIGIDTVMGKILWEKCPWAGFVSLSGGLASPTLEQNSLFWYSFGAYFEFHLPTLTGKLLKEYLHTDKSMPPFAIKKSVFTEDYIYFIASQKSMILSNIVGVFNRKTLEIDWQEELDILPKTKSDPYTSLTDIQLGNNKLYVLDSGGTLHIFEREG